MSKKLGVKISPGVITPNFIMNFPLVFLLRGQIPFELGRNFLLTLTRETGPRRKARRKFFVRFGEISPSGIFTPNYLLMKLSPNE